MTPLEAMAREVCLHGGGGFCENVGGDLGCKNGRGCHDAGKCIASADQLALSGNTATARAALDALASNISEGMVQEAVDNVGPIGCCSHTPATARETFTAMLQRAKEEG